MNQFWSGNECERAHTLTTTTTGSKNSEKEANNQTSNQNSVPSKGLFLTDSWSWMKSSARNTLSNQQAQPKEAETVNLTENVAKDTFKRSLLDCQENVSNTTLTIVCTINVSIDCDCFDVSIPSERENIHKIKLKQQEFFICLSTSSSDSNSIEDLPRSSSVRV